MCEAEEWEEDKEAPSSEFNFKTETRFGVDRFSRFVRSLVCVQRSTSTDDCCISTFYILFYFILFLFCCVVTN